MNRSTTMDVRSYEFGQYQKRKNKRDIESGGNRKASQGKEAEVVWACDEKRGALRRKEGDGNEKTREKEERNTQEKMVGQSSVRPFYTEAYMPSCIDPA